MVKKISYYSVFWYDTDGINIRFPDVGALSCADTKEEAIFMAEDALCLWLHGMKLQEVPPKTSLEDIVLNEHEELVEITVEMQIINEKLFSPNVQKL